MGKKRMKRWIFSFGMMMLLFFLGGTLKIKAESKDSDRIIKIGYTDYGGFINQNEDGSYTGYGVELLMEIAKYTGWKYEYVFDTWDNLLKKVETGEVDFVCQAQKTPEREDRFLYSKYWAGTETCVLYVREDDDRFYYNDFESFDGIRVAGLKNSFQNIDLSEYADYNHFSYQLMEYDIQQECFDALDSGEVDAVVQGSLAGKNGYKIICRFGAQPFYLMTRKTNPEMVDEADYALGEITADSPSFLSDLYQKYYADTAASGIAFTREEMEYIKKQDLVTIAFLANRAPFSSEDVDGKLAGITVDILNQIKEISGLNCRYTILKTGQRATEYLEENPDALIAGVIVDNPDFSKEEYLVSKKMYQSEVSLVCRNGTNYKPQNAEVAYTVAIPKSYAALENFIKDKYPHFEIVKCTTTENCMEMLRDGRVDFVAQNVNIITPYLQSPYYEGITVLPTFFMNENVGIVGKRNSENEILISIMNKCINQVSEQDISQFTINNTIESGYHLTWKDALYKFRFPIAALIILLIGSIALVFTWQETRKQNYLKIAEKNEQLQQAIDQANRANRTKSDFLARMSHEIRTPMNAIVGLTEIAKHHEAEPEKVDEYLNKIDVSSRVLLNIINDILDMSAIENKKMKIAHEPFVMSEIMDSVQIIYAPQCIQKNIAFEVHYDDISHSRLVGDSLRIKQILLNLVSNAYKFTPFGGNITVEAKEVSVLEDKAYFNFTISDTGEGMTEEMQTRLFRPFEQESATTAQKYGGSGLGLSIAKNLVELMSGSISAKSKKGEGTTFVLSIPFDIDRTLKEDQEKQAVGKMEYDFSGRKVLLAEDTKFNAEVATELLHLVHMEVDCAKDGKEAVEMFEKSDAGTYTAIFLDIQMPVMNGYDAARAIRKLDREDAHRIAIYAMTANSYTEDVSAALNAGMNGHIAKPIDAQTLYEILDGVTKNNEDEKT